MKLPDSDRKSLIRLASSLPKGSEERRTILAVLKETKEAASFPDFDLLRWLRGIKKDLKRRGGVDVENTKVELNTRRNYYVWSADLPEGSFFDLKEKYKLAAHAGRILQGLLKEKGYRMEVQGGGNWPDNMIRFTIKRKRRR